MACIRQQTEEIESSIFSPFATLNQNSKGRKTAEEQCAIRTDFQRDRDRIIHCKAFRRLKQKTQVFLSPEGDHYRTRLTHTLEVSQIARTIARAMRLNEDLTEAIALGHDLGHTPFGHAGERALNKLCPDGFQHNVQSVRVVNFLERNHAGLNLTFEVLNGMQHHTGAVLPQTPEGMIVRHADRIAYINHDIEDAITAGVLKAEDLPAHITKILGDTKSARITTLIVSILENSKNADIRFAADVEKVFLELRAFMYQSVYMDPFTKAEESKVENILSHLFHHFKENPNEMPQLYREIADNAGTSRAVTDYVAGMSDDYAIKKFELLYIPKKWAH